MEYLLSRYSVFIFDLDDTVYPEIEYLTRAYKYISDCIIAKEGKQTTNSDEIFDFLLNTFKKSGRNSLFQKLQAKYELKHFKIEDFLYCLRNVPIPANTIKVYKEVEALLNNLVEYNKKLYILTNGNINQQKNKVNIVDIPHKDKISLIYASTKGPLLQKPSPYYINKISKESNVIKEQLLFIGDSLTDQQTAINAEISFLHVSNILM